MLRDGTVTGRVSWTFHDLGSRTPAHAVPGQSGRPVDGGAPSPEQTPAELRLAVTMPDGQLSRTLALVPMTVSGSRAISAPLLCPSGCRLDAFEFRLTDAATSAVEGTLRLAGLTVDGTPLPLAEPERWLPFSAQTDGGGLPAGQGRHLRRHPGADAEEHRPGRPPRPRRRSRGGARRARR